MIILGIDKGYAIVGIGVIEYKGNKFRPLEYNAITTNAHTMTSHRLKIIYDEENIVLDEYNENVEIVSDVEKLIYSNIYGQLKTFIQNKPVLVQEINSEMQEVIEKYKDVITEE